MSSRSSVYCTYPSIPSSKGTPSASAASVEEAVARIDLDNMPTDITLFECNDDEGEDEDVGEQAETSSATA